MADPAAPVVSTDRTPVRPPDRTAAVGVSTAARVDVSAPPATAAAVRARLEAKTALIQTRVSALEGEAVGAALDTRDAVFRNPAVSVGGSLVVGLLVGLLVGKPTPKTRFDSAIAHLPKSMRGSAEGWAQAAEREVRRATRKGEDAGDALRGFFNLNHPPVASEARVQEKQRKGIITGALLSILTTALTAAAKTAVENMVKGSHRTTAAPDDAS